MNDKVFFDANALLYTVSADEAKANRASTLLIGGGVVSVQVLNEIALVSLRKFGATWEQTHALLEAVCANCQVESLTLRTHELGLQLAQRYQFRVYDAMIVSAALLSGADILYSEDLHDGLVVEKHLTVRNPFKRGAQSKA